MERVFLIVLDSAGCGYLPDADKYNDVGANTLLHISEKVKNFDLPHLEQMGLLNLINPKKGRRKSKGVYGKMAERSPGKDTTTGHWEIAGLVLKKAFPVYPDGFPKDVLEEFMRKNGLDGYLGNMAASGTQIIQDLGEEHQRTGYPIVYTSADSVFQIAAHEKTFGLERLYDICETTRNLLKGDHCVGRVIARPFLGQKKGEFKRTENRKDYSLTPPDNTLLDHVKEAGQEVIAVGKIHDIFNGQGITRSLHTGNNAEGIQAVFDILNEKTTGLVFVNLVDFDMLYGHRRNVSGYYKALKEFDKALDGYLKRMRDTDTFFITADHGNDPTFIGTDHTREYVPVLGYGKQLKENVFLGTRESFADLGQTIADILGVKPPGEGKSFYDLIRR
ncbi:MAG: phosphopentomutase [Spirochaetes bacterium]|nr:phosphopentomutase [Spirochaetota bacterium]